MIRDLVFVTGNVVLGTVGVCLVLIGISACARAHRRRRVRQAEELLRVRFARRAEGKQ